VILSTFEAFRWVAECFTLATVLCAVAVAGRAGAGLTPGCPAFARRRAETGDRLKGYLLYYPGSFRASPGIVARFCRGGD
jgi:hypothetical protein